MLISFTVRVTALPEIQANIASFLNTCSSANINDNSQGCPPHSRKDGWPKETLASFLDSVQDSYPMDIFLVSSSHIELKGPYAEGVDNWVGAIQEWLQEALCVICVACVLWSVLLWPSISLKPLTIISILSITYPWKYFHSICVSIFFSMPPVYKRPSSIISLHHILLSWWMYNQFVCSHLDNHSNRNIRPKSRLQSRQMSHISDLKM